jgi:hypothetical protein
MKYYCKECKSVLEPGFCTEITETGTAWEYTDFHFSGNCPYCSDKIVKIPDYETPARYEKRTGKKYPNNGLVWFRFHWENGRKISYRWSVTRYNNASQYSKSPYCDVQIVIADPPVQPPDDWEPEEGV